MHRGTLLAIGLVFAPGPITAWAQHAERVTDTSFENYRMAVWAPRQLFKERVGTRQTVDGTPTENASIPVETLLLRTDFDVDRERAKLEQRYLKDCISNSNCPPYGVLSVAAGLLERLEAWLRMGQTLGYETPELKPLQRRLAEVRVEIARIDAGRTRQNYERIRKPGPPIPRLVRFQCSLNLATTLTQLGNRQVELLPHVVAGHGETKELEVVLEQLSKRREQLENDTDRMLEDPEQLP